jgi:hypothetical protein
MPVSMLPRATALTKNDLLYLVQPGNNPGEKSRSLTLEGLVDSDVFRLQGVRNAIMKSNILEYSGALAETSTGQFTEICHVDIDPRLDVEFHVWGTSGAAGDAGDTYSSYDYGFRAKVHQMYLPDDQDRDLIVYAPAGHRTSSADGPADPCYNAIFGCLPFEYNPTAGELSHYPTKTVTLYLATGTTMNPYHATPPSSFSLKIQATIFPSKYVTGTLLAPASP